MDDRTKIEMIRTARLAMTNAWAPYSRFKVGAAVLGGSGRIFSGCNVENSSYPVTTCAERNAIGAAVAAGERNITAIVVTAGHREPVTPCGMCRQAMAEFGPDIEVVCVGEGGGEERFTVRELLPAAFGSEKLPGSTQWNINLPEE